MKRIEQTLLETSAAATELDQVCDKVFFFFRGLTGWASDNIPGT